MASGYEGLVEIDGLLVLATSASAPKTRNKLDSTSGYDGTASGAVQQGIGYPHEYDFNSYDGSVAVDMTQLLFDTRLKDWIINNRTQSKAMFIQTRKGNGNTGFQQLNEVYWNSISFETSPGAVVSSTINFVAWRKSQDPAFEIEYNTVSDRFLANRAGLLTQYGLKAALGTGGQIPALNGVPNTAPIPYWATTIPAFSGGGVNPISWSITFNQDATKLFLCNAQSTVQAPSLIAFGPMTGQFQTEVMVLNSDFGIPATANILVNIGSNDFSLGTCQDVNFGDDLKTGSESVPVSLTYDIYGPLG